MKSNTATPATDEGGRDLHAEIERIYRTQTFLQHKTAWLSDQQKALLDQVRELLPWSAVAGAADDTATWRKVEAALSATAYAAHSASCIAEWAKAAVEALQELQYDLEDCDDDLDVDDDDEPDQAA